MKLINAFKPNTWKTALDKSSVESRPFGANPVRAYISKPVESCIDFFNKVSGQVYGNASTCHRSFYSWIQWLAMEYVSDTKSLGWGALDELCKEYGNAYSVELTQAQYNVIAYRDNEYLTIDYKASDFSGTVGPIDVQHSLGYAPVMASYVDTNKSKRLLGIDIDANRVYCDTVPGESWLLFPGFHNTIGFQAIQDFGNQVVMPNDDPTVHSHLAMIQVVSTGTGKTIEYSYTGANRAHTKASPYQTLGGVRTPARLDYDKKSVRSKVSLPGYHGSVIRHDFGDGNQNFVMHSADYCSSADYDTIPQWAKDTYTTGSEIRKISPEVERGRRYSLTVATEPYQTMTALDGANVCEISVVTSNGTPGIGRFVCIKSNHSMATSIESAMNNPGYNNDIIDTIAILDSSYLGDNAAAMNTLDRLGARGDAGVCDELSGTKTVFELTQAFLGNALHEEIRYKYPAGRVFCVGIGAVNKLDGGVVYRLYCAGLPAHDMSDLTGYSIVALEKASGYTGAIPIAIDHNGERLGPVVRVPGISGYVRLVRRLKSITPDHKGWQQAAVYEAEIPFVFGAHTVFKNCDPSLGFVMTQHSYIKAGSWRRYESIDSSSGVKTNPTILDYNWIGSNHRTGVDWSSAILGPVEYYESQASTQQNQFVYNNASADMEANATFNSGVLIFDKTLVSDGSAAVIIKRLCCVSNKYWMTHGSRPTGYPGREYPAFDMKLDSSKAGSHIYSDSAINIEDRWFIGRCIGGGDCENAVNPSIAAMPFMNNDLALWVKNGLDYDRVVVNSRNTTIDSVIGVNMEAYDIIANYNPAGGTSPDSSLISVKLRDSTGMEMLKQLYQDFDADNSFYNANLQCLYKKTGDASMIYCQTKSFKIVSSSFNGAPSDLDFHLELVVFVDDGESMTDSVEGLRISLYVPYPGRIIGFCNILSPKSNHGGVASAKIDTSEVFHVFSRVPNKYNGIIVEYIGVYKSAIDAMAAVYGLPAQTWMYYNVLENTFYVYNGDTWQSFYQISDWSGIKPEYIDVMSSAFKTGIGATGYVEIVFGHQPKRLPLPEHCLSYIAPPSAYDFVTTVMDGSMPSSLALRYAGLLTKS